MFSPSDILFQISTIFEDFWSEAILVLLIIAAILYRNNKKKIFTIFLSVLFALITGFILKETFQIPRPCVVNPSLIPCPKSFSFPSLHSAFSFAFVAATIGTKPFYILFPLVLLIVFTRVFLGVHTLVDILSGLVIAIVSFFVARYIIDRFFEGRKNG